MRSVECVVAVADVVLGVVVVFVSVVVVAVVVVVVVVVTVNDKGGAFFCFCIPPLGPTCENIRHNIYIHTHT